MMENRVLVYIDRVEVGAAGWARVQAFDERDQDIMVNAEILLSDVTPELEVALTREMHLGDGRFEASLNFADGGRLEVQNAFVRKVDSSGSSAQIIAGRAGWSPA